MYEPVRAQFAKESSAMGRRKGPLRLNLPMSSSERESERTGAEQARQSREEYSFRPQLKELSAATSCEFANNAL